MEPGPCAARIACRECTQGSGALTSSEQVLAPSSTPTAGISVNDGAEMMAPVPGISIFAFSQMFFIQLGPYLADCKLAPRLVTRTH